MEDKKTNAVVVAVLTNCWPGAHGQGFTKDDKLNYAKTEGPLAPEMVQRHLAGLQPYTVFLAEPGAETTRLAVIDIDNKAKYAVVLTADELTAKVAALCDVARQRFALLPVVCVSRSTTGRNVWLRWEEPQDCADVHAALTAVADAVGLHEAKGQGVGSGQCEIMVNGAQGVALPCFAGNPVLLASGEPWIEPSFMASAPVPRAKAVQRRRATRSADDGVRIAAPPSVDARLRSALAAIPSDDYDDWINVGLVLKTVLGDDGKALWVEWSAGSAAHTARDANKWDGFKPKGRLTLATIFWMARQRGWLDPSLPCTQFGNKERFVEQHAERLRYVHGLGAWLHYGAGIWYRNDALAAKKCEATIKSIFSEAAATTDPDHAKKLGAWAMSSQNKRELDAVLGLAKNEPALGVVIDDLDADTWLLGVRNGVVDLRTGELLRADPRLLITKTVGCEYVVGARCPQWLAFVEWCFPSADVRAYVQRLFGHLLTGETGERCLWFFEGAGDNGKSVLVAVLQALFADYGANVEPHTFMVKRNEGGATPDIARLVGKRLAVGHELSDTMRMNLPFVKRMSGGTDRITARNLYGAPFEFTPQFKVVLVTNHLPRIEDDDEAVWKRVRVVHFVNQIAEDKKDTALAEKLLAELPGILLWALEGCLQWQREGRRLQQPQAVVEDSRAYRKSQNWVDRWLDSGDMERVVDAKCTTSWAYEQFKKWCQQQNAAERQLPDVKKFTAAMEARGFERRKERKATFWLGLRGAVGTAADA